MILFTKVLEDLEMKDLPSPEGHFTWWERLNSHSKSKLYRFQIAEWETKFMRVVHSALLGLVLDYFHVLLDGRSIRRGPTPLIFKNMWLREEGFRDILHALWEGLSSRVLASYVSQPINLVGGLYQ